MSNAEGQGQITATAGPITALNQTKRGAIGGDRETLHGTIQTNADIVPGWDSGGPLGEPAGPASSAWTPRATTRTTR